MRVVFMGTPDFAVPVLEALATRHEILAVYTRADAVSGRGGARRPTPVKAAASRSGVPVYEPASLRDPHEIARLAALAPDVCVVAAYGVILPREILDIPRLGCINVHASLLPRWRGAAPIQRAILAGDERTGVSIMRMEEGLDTGPFCATAETEIGLKTAEQLTSELADLGASALLIALDGLERGACDFHVQDPDSVTYAEKITKSDVVLTPDLTTAEASRRIRASGATAPARLTVDGVTLTVLAVTGSRMSPAPAPAHVHTGKHAVDLGFADGGLEVTRVKPEAKGEMRAADWARGRRLSDATWEGA